MPLAHIASVRFLVQRNSGVQKRGEWARQVREYSAEMAISGAAATREF